MYNSGGGKPFNLWKDGPHLSYSFCLNEPE